MWRMECDAKLYRLSRALRLIVVSDAHYKDFEQCECICTLMVDFGGLPLPL